jgi:hypothetical protein
LDSDDGFWSYLPSSTANPEHSAALFYSVMFCRQKVTVAFNLISCIFLQFPKGQFLNYLSLFLPIFDQLSTLVSIFSKL